MCRPSRHRTFFCNSEVARCRPTADPAHGARSPWRRSSWIFSPSGAQDMGTSYTTTRAGSPSETARAFGVPLTRRGITSWSRLNLFCVCIVRGPSLRIHY